MAAPPQAASRRVSTIIEPRPPPRSSASSYTGTSSLHYGSTRRHSLYGTEDRIIIDPGSKYWKVGFSGEGKPRDIYEILGSGPRRDMPSQEEDSHLWSSSAARTPEEREEADRMLAAGLQDALRAVFFETLMTDPKSRKVIIVEHPLLPLRVKDLIAQILFDNLNIPSLSFASSPMLALLATGRTTGLVVDCGHLETTALPISSARPMFPYLRTTPRAGASLTTHLRSLILEFGTYHPPFASLAGSANAAPSTTRVPPEIVTTALIEDLKTSRCFVGAPLQDSASVGHSSRMEMDSPIRGDGASLQISSPPQGQRSGSHSGLHTPLRPSASPSPSAAPQEAWVTLYENQSSATDFMIPVNPPPPLTGTGRGAIRVPGWVRERAAEHLFSGGDVDEPSVVEVILQSILKVPVDLRRRMISNILIVGGTPMLPGFIPRLQKELAFILSKPLPTPSVRSPKRRVYDPFDSLRPLAAHVAILNNPSPPDASKSSSSMHSGKAPAFSPLSVAWVGGSLAGVLKTGGEEILHDKWDEATVEILQDTTVVDPTSASFQDPNTVTVKESTYVLPDWTRVPMVVGAPHAGKHAPRQFGVPLDQQQEGVTA